jgi:hypothetical protein
MSAIRPFEPVSDLQLLAAIDRAERHSRCSGVQRGRIAEHLGFARGARTTRLLRPQIDALIAAGALMCGKRHGSIVWGLMPAGRRRLARARRDGKNLDLPEAPQHQRWRASRQQATSRIDEFRGELRRTLTDAQALLDSECQATAWSDLSRRLRQQCALLGWALYCIHEWAEPDDAQPDTDVSRRLRELHLIGGDLSGPLP